MAEIATVTLSPLPTPEAWRREWDLRDVFVLDAYSHRGTPEIVVTADTRHGDCLAALFPGATVSPVAGGSRITGHGARLAALGADLEITTQQRDDLAWCAGRNTLLAIATEPEAVNIADWLHHHRRHHGAEAALILLRCRRDWDLPGFARSLADHPGDLGRILLVDVDRPLGQADLGPESDRWFAPDAPGKAALGPPAPDPWRSNLAEVAILEVMRRRFLADARAVLRCDHSDLVAPAGDATPFDLVQTGTGFLRIAGRLAYPFGLTDEIPPRHGDHACTAFDGSRAGSIWCVAPRRLPDEAFWRQFRVSATEPDPAGANLAFWRCMAIRHPDLKVGELVPKSSLVAETGLAALMRDSFGADPKLPPPPAPTAPLRNDRILAVTTMKNEGPFILEWLAWHRAIGVTDFLVYTNDCTDGTDTMFDLLAARGLVTHTENPYRDTGAKPQHAAYLAAENTDLARAADWVVCMDVDEFINIHTGDGTLSALFAAVPDATMISMTWRLFGNSDIAAFADRPVIEQFTTCAPLMCRKPHQAWGFKTLFRNLGHYKKFGVHRPKGLRPEYLDRIRYVNGSGKPMPDRMLRGGWRSSTSTIGYELVTLNHYALRSAESFLVKRDRGRVNHVNRDQGLNYWFRMNHNGETDRSILRHLPRFHAELARLMADPDIAAMHAACVDAHRARIADLMQRPDYAALFAEITGDRLRALSRQLHRFGSREFEAGPDSIAG